MGPVLNVKNIYFIYVMYGKGTDTGANAGYLNPVRRSENIKLTS